MLPFNIYVIQAIFTGAVVVCRYLGHKYCCFGGGQRTDAGAVPPYDPIAVLQD